MRNYLWIALGGALLLSSCEANTSHRQISAAAPETSTATPLPDSTQTGTLICTGTLRLLVDSLVTARRHINSLLLQYKAYVSQEHEERLVGTAETRLEIRVPRSSLTVLTDALCRSARQVDHKELKADEVGIEFTDIRARLSARMQLEHRYLQLLQQAGKVSEMIAVEQQLNAVRTEIETLQGRLIYLSNKVAMATLTVSLYEDVAQASLPSPGFFARAVQQFTGSFELVKEAVLLCVALWPLLLVGLPPLLVRRRNKKGPAAA